MGINKAGPSHWNLLRNEPQDVPVASAGHIHSAFHGCGYGLQRDMRECMGEGESKVSVLGFWGCCKII
jgi:hypothetical protein